MDRGQVCSPVPGPLGHKQIRTGGLITTVGQVQPRLLLKTGSSSSKYQVSSPDLKSQGSPAKVLVSLQALLGPVLETTLPKLHHPDPSLKLTVIPEMEH